ncbi:glutathione S-transferase theta-1-like [Hydractinia symbiolongicarpus]|uniref:glutathione S-transferase theta-1-like n=1 Tax=Hydractinia symbiolongicarpus TaxID=13093 RepID=UPI00254EBB76|nr:glutathione S-transferase theta-1-like [Hydractinia symbiolongicarpus]
MLKLHAVRISPCCRIVWLYCLQNNLPLEINDVDIFGGEHNTNEFRELSPHGEIPLLVDGEVKIYGACAILFYLGEKYTKFNRFGESNAEKAMVNSLLSWTSLELHSTAGHRVVYPHFMEQYHLEDDATESLIEKGTIDLTRHLEMLENLYLSKTKYLTGGFPTIADYYVATVLVQLEWINFGLELWPKISAWLSILKGMQQWKEVHEKHSGFVAELQKHDV